MSEKFNLPLYSQLANTCGISTFLMLINPQKNEKFKLFLNDIYKKLSYFRKYSRDEFKWSVVIDYLLLKSMGNNILKDFLSKKNPDITDVYMPIVHYELQDKNFAENNVITKYVLKKSLHKMRTDADLKILFYLFGGEFYPQQNPFPDGTGGLFFTHDDFFPNESKFKDKINVLKSHLEKKENGKMPCIALNVGYHWIAINYLRKNTIGVNNPLNTSPSEKNISRTIPERYRFYLFSYNQDDAFILKKNVKNFILSEIENKR